MDPDDDDTAALRARVDALEQTVSEQQATIDALSDPPVSRRGVLAALTGVAGAGALGAYSQRGAAQAAGQVGTSAEPVDVEAWSLNVQDQLAGDLDAGGNNLTNVGAVETEKGRFGTIEYVPPSDDAQSIIEGAPAGSHIFLDPSGTWDIVPPFEPPTDITLWGSRNVFSGKQNPDAVAPTLQKAGDGDLMAVPNGFSATGVVFDGDRSNYTGDGLVDSAWNHNGINLHNVKIQHVAGDARVHDATAFCYYRQLLIQSCDGAAIKNISTDYDSVRRSRFEEIRASDCASGIHSTDTGERDNYWHVRFTNLNGPGLHYALSSGESISNVEVRGDIRNCDDPGIYLNGGHINNLDVSAKMKTNADNVSVPVSSTVASDLHIESADTTWSRVKFDNSWIGDGGADAGATIWNHHDTEFEALKLTLSQTRLAPPRVIGGAVDAIIDTMNGESLDWQGNDATAINATGVSQL